MNIARLSLCLVACLLAACATTSPQPEPFPASGSYAEIFASMDAANKRAREQGKLAMHVMGANWCHDSVGFVGKTSDPAFAALIEERYVVNLINVGELEYVREVINRYGEPVIYGTPTVLVVEPETDTLLNRATLPYWRSADSIDMQDTLAYFQAFQPGQLPPPEVAASPALAAALADIDAFEARQAERIYQAYDELGAMIREEDAQAPSQDFIDKWTNLAQMRGQITGDLDGLRESARSQDSAGVDPIELSYPEYSLFID